MLKDALGTHSVIAVALAGALDSAGNPAIPRVIGGGVIVEHQQLPDGRSNVVLHGVGRIAIEELPFVPPYRRAKAEILHDVHTPVSSNDRTALLAEATAFATEVHKQDPNFSFRLPASLEPGAIADLCANQLVIDSAARQRILEELDVAQRVRLVIEELAQQHGALLKEGGRVLH
jgi:Lon protease-like protein